MTGRQRRFFGLFSRSGRQTKTPRFEDVVAATRAAIL